ncbi:hypothetical protein IEQ34_016878 [Dendrobium chrysotoxum]|uniref:Uncharacterized protein n=1 Tax=Dendrobium chrysotoxum TaxID=161865 RepID=A0AAV7GH05_DENCH|nr:hypothetical protein IEQ34_016878 [Dendrobium chrysotoxum]
MSFLMLHQPTIIIKILKKLYPYSLIVHIILIEVIGSLDGIIAMVSAHLSIAPLLGLLKKSYDFYLILCMKTQDERLWVDLLLEG